MGILFLYLDINKNKNKKLNNIKKLMIDKFVSLYYCIRRIVQ